MPINNSHLKAVIDFPLFRFYMKGSFRYTDLEADKLHVFFVVSDRLWSNGQFCPLSTLFAVFFFMEVAIDSRLSPAKVRWRQPAVSSELSLVTAS